MNFFGKAFQVWREFDNGYASDPELIEMIQRALWDVYNEGYDEGHSQALENHGLMAPRDDTEVDENVTYLSEIGEDEEFSLGR